MRYETLRCESKGAVAWITLDRPEKLNALSPGMQQELRDALAELEAGGETRCAVLTGAGRAFCAGADLAGEDTQFSDDHKPDLGASLERNFNPTIRALCQAPFPTIAAVNGPSVGAGMSLALACDFALAGRSAWFSQAFCNIGLVPDAGSTWFLPRLVGPARASALVMLGERIPAERAEAWGLIWRCVEDAELVDAASELAAELGSKATRTLVLSRQALRAAATQDLDAQLDLERDLQRVVGWTDDAREGIEAFGQKRTPNFRGR
jgi:2-(1,2-epoxy-1,2-dihydrophenyl)acetyl-CoA isomerase